MIEEPTSLQVNRNWKRPSAEQVAAFQGMPTGFVADALGGGGAMNSGIQPIGRGMDLVSPVAGPVVTADNAPGDILGTLGALSLIETGDVLVAGFAGFQGCASGGDRVMGMLKNSGGIAFITDGPMRDYQGIVQVGLPVWCTGLNPASPFSTGPAKVGMAITMGGQPVSSGDMIVADRDGVVVVPHSRIPAVIEQLKKIQALEIELDADVESGLKIPQAITDLLAGSGTTYVDE